MAHTHCARMPQYGHHLHRPNGERMDDEDSGMALIKKCFYVLLGITVVVILIVTIYLFDENDQRNLMLRAALASEAFPLSPQGCWQQTEYRVRSDPARQWSILEDCAEPLHAFFIVTSEASDWRGRAEIRDTLLEDRLRRTLRWTGAFVVQEAREPLVADWIEVEGQAMGDLMLLLPARDRSAPGFDEFHVAVRWVLQHCPEVRYIVKIAADTLVHPTRLFKFLRSADASGLDAVLCEMRRSSRLHRGTDAAVSVAKAQFFTGAHQLHCTGSVVLASLEMLRDSDQALLPAEPEAAFVRKRSQRKDEDTSLEIRNVAVGSINSTSLDIGWDLTFMKVKDRSVRGLERYASWYFAVWKDLVWNKPRFKHLLAGPRHRNSKWWKQLES